MGTSGTTGLKAAARGRWPSLLASLGVDESYLSGKHGPCPMCGGKDRWRFTDHGGDGLWICNQCGSGDGFSLLMAYNGWDFREAKKAVGDLIPQATFTKPRDDDREKARAALNRLRQEAVPADEVQSVVRYLISRGLEVPPNLEAHPSLPYYDESNIVGRYSAMLGRVVAKSGRPVTYHRTYVTDTGKAPVESPRKMMRTARGAKGWAIRLYPADSEIVIAEGIETAIACKQLWGIPSWSVVSANGMLDFEPPEGVERVVVAGDNDANFTGQAAAYEKARRLVEKGYSTEVRIPDKPGDWNDEWMRLPVERRHV